MTPTTQVRPGTVLTSLVLVGLLAVLYREPFTWLVTVDWAREDYGSSAFVPLIAAYLVYERRALLKRTPRSPAWTGALPVLAGVLLYWVGELSGEFFTMYLSFWLVLSGLTWSWMGSRRLKVLAFPLFFLLAMFPLPNYLNTMVTLKLKLISSWLGVWMIRLYGMSAYREGNVIDLGFTRLQVVDACSGLRYFIPLVVLALLLASYYRAPLWKRGLFVLSAVPVSILTNGLRIASVGILYRFFGPVVAEGFFHDFSGWFIFMFSLGILLLELRLFKRYLPDPVRSQAEPEAAAERPSAPPPLCPPQLAVPALLLVLSLAVSAGVDFRQKVVPAGSLGAFPLELPGWKGSRTTMEQPYLDALKLDDYAMVEYRDGEKRAVSLYVAYYGSQSKGVSVHSPASCLPGSGWEFEESGAVAVPLAAGSMRVSRAYMEKGGGRQLTYYWFPQRGRVLTNLWQLKLYTLWDAITRRRTDGALVRVITPLYGSERPADAEARLQGFTREVVPVLARFIPR